MERRIGAKIDSYTIAFKDEVASKLRDLNVAVAALSNEKHETGDKDKDQQMQNQQSQNKQVDGLFKQIISFVYDYEKLKLTKEDFMKRKRVKNIVPSQYRCHAKRANGEQCTRKKKAGCDYCGTHTKGVPSSIMDDAADGSSSAIVSQQNVNVWVQNIKGIEYFIDSKNNVYKHEDVIDNTANPQIIAKCSKNETGLYSIEFL
jgi:outer membrane murein-binding lipoprotein Lpp